MSYEGREFLMCDSGHVTVIDASMFMYRDPDNKLMCCARKCLNPLTKVFSVDDTNGDGIEPQLNLQRGAVVHICLICSDAHVIEEAQYEPISSEVYQWVDILENALPMDRTDGRGLDQEDI